MLPNDGEDAQAQTAAEEELCCGIEPEATHASRAKPHFHHAPGKNMTISSDVEFVLFPAAVAPAVLKLNQQRGEGGEDR